VDCLFCKIGSGEIQSLTIYEDSNVRAFLDIHPLTLGHTVVVPKKHYGNVIDLPEELVGPVFLGVKKAAEMLKLGLGIEGFTIGINHGTIGHQEIDHLHVHVIPRRSGDGGGNIHSIVHEASNEDLEVTYKRILDKNK